LIRGSAAAYDARMPIYEYVCEADGEVIELLRPMSEADKPVEDPEGKGRRFIRRHSVFGVSGAAQAAATSLPMQGCCPCGKPQSACGRN
jgi:putative FmdB family regulatory protein